jgi:hypothetical protein
MKPNNVHTRGWSRRGELYIFLSWISHVFASHLIRESDENSVRVSKIVDVKLTLIMLAPLLQEAMSALLRRRAVLALKQTQIDTFRLFTKYVGTAYCPLPGL